jgi:hypothetical protein
MTSKASPSAAAASIASKQRATWSTSHIENWISSGCGALSGERTSAADSDPGGANSVT